MPRLFARPGMDTNLSVLGLLVLATCANAPLSAQAISASAVAATTLAVRAGTDNDSRPAGFQIGAAGLSIGALDAFGTGVAAAQLRIAVEQTATSDTLIVHDKASSTTPVLQGQSGSHAVRWNLTSAAPVNGVLRVRYELPTNGASNVASASVDVDGDGALEWRSGSEEVQTWQRPIVVDGTVSVLTRSEAGGAGVRGDGMLTLEFVQLPVTATARAVTRMQATAEAVRRGVSAGTDLTPGLRLLAEDHVGSTEVTASTAIRVDHEPDVVRYSIRERGDVRGSNTATTSTGLHTSLLRLESLVPIAGELTIHWRKRGDARAAVDLMDDGIYEWDSNQAAWSTAAVVNGSLAIRVDTASNGNSEGVLEIEFRGKRTLVLPDNHYLTGDPTVVTMAGSSDWWRSSGGRFQLLYEAGHFLDHGVTGPITIKQLRFRLRDGLPDRGGRLWPNVRVRLGSTFIGTRGLSSNFSQNFNLPTTVGGAVGVGDVRMRASSGSVPNGDCIVIDLESLGATIVHDPTGGRPNLLIEVVMPMVSVAPAGSAEPWMQVAVGSGDYVRGRGVTSGDPISATGTTSGEPLVVAVAHDDAGGYADPIAARNESFGAACGGAPSSFYQSFVSGQVFDLSGITVTPDTYPSPSKYTVTAGAGAFDPTKLDATPDSVGDNQGVVHGLGFPFEFPDGRTTRITASTNGFLWLAQVGFGNHHPHPTVDGLLAGVPRLAPFWSDLHCGRNQSTHANSGLHVRTVGVMPNRVCFVTWFDVGTAAVAGAGQVAYDVQCALFESTGVVEFRYGDMPSFCSTGPMHADPELAALIGFSRGASLGSVAGDPQSRDLSIEVPFSTHVEGANGGGDNLGLRAVGSPEPGGSYGGRLYRGQVLQWMAFNIPPGSLLGAMLIDFRRSQPGLSFPWIHAPGCIESTSISPIAYEMFVAPGGGPVLPAPLVVSPSYDPNVVGLEIYAQFVTLDASGNGPPISASSNAIRHVVGLR